MVVGRVEDDGRALVDVSDMGGVGEDQSSAAVLLHEDRYGEEAPRHGEGVVVGVASSDDERGPRPAGLRDPPDPGGAVAPVDRRGEVADPAERIGVGEGADHHVVERAAFGREQHRGDDRRDRDFGDNREAGRRGARRRVIEVIDLDPGDVGPLLGVGVDRSEDTVSGEVRHDRPGRHRTPVAPVDCSDEVSNPRRRCRRG